MRGTAGIHRIPERNLTDSSRIAEIQAQLPIVMPLYPAADERR